MGITSTEDASRVRVIIVDDEPLIRSGIRAILGADSNIEVLAEAGDGREAVDAVAGLRPEVVLLDIRMPRLHGLAAITEILHVQRSEEHTSELQSRGHLVCRPQLR